LLAPADSVPSRVDFIVGWFRQYGLAVWFLVVSGLVVGRLALAGADVSGDAELYLVATRRWLNGTDPWATPIGDWWFGAPPPTLLAMAPFAVLPPELGRWMVLATTVVAGVATVRLLRLPWWWLAFPPLLLSMFGNPQAWLVPLLVGGWGWLAPIVKLYAAPVLLLQRRWRDLAVSVLIIVISAPLLPWGSYIAQFQAISGHLADQSPEFSAFGSPILMAIAIVGLVLVGRERASWLVTPALWPSTQWYYSSLAVPALMPAAGALVALPIPGIIVAAILITAVEVRLVERSASHTPKPTAVPT